MIGCNPIQSPFPSLHVFNGVSAADFLLHASAAMKAPPPPDLVMKQTRVLLVKNPSNDPARRKILVKLQGDAGGGFPTLTGATLVVRVDGTTQCFQLPASAWSQGGSFQRYADPTGAHGPVRVALLRNTPSGVLIKVNILGRLGPIDLVPPDPGAEGAVNFRVPATPFFADTQNCGSTNGGTLGPNNARAFRATNAPPPSTCQVEACSPSGAFLDEDGGLS